MLLDAVPTRTPTLVVERLDAGETPREVVTDLVAEAMAVAEGRIPRSRCTAGPDPQIQEAENQQGATAGLGCATL
jgi:hypothetical protein